MLNRLKLIINNGTIMKRLGFTLLILFIYKMATYIAVPMLETNQMVDYITKNDFLQFLDTFAGNALGNFSIVALGISPYITASIITQLLQMDIVPIFKEWSEQGDAGKQKMNQTTRYIAIILAFIQALALLFGLNSQPENLISSPAEIPTWVAMVYVAIVMSAGTAFVLWLADLITRRGVGNGSSMIIVAGILTSFPAAIYKLWGQYTTVNEEGTNEIWKFWLIIGLYVLVLVGVIYMQIATRKVPTQYANRQGKTDSHIPIKLNSAGVIPVIFAATLMSVPNMIANVLENSDNSDFVYWLEQIFDYSNPIGFILYVILIVVFTFFYSFLMINPEKIAENLQRQNAFIPGVRPGEETQNYLARLLFKITVIGGTYLTILAIIPIITSKIFELPASFTIGGTSLLIVVGVAVETVKQIETEATDKTYKGFIE